MPRLIDADALKDKLQQHHDFYVMAWGGFDKMSIGEKKRVDEITNCIAEVVNAPNIEPMQGEWIEMYRNGFGNMICMCSKCNFHAIKSKFCPNCGARMKGADDERKYYRKCGDCGCRYEQPEMVRTRFSDNGWLCKENSNA